MATNRDRLRFKFLHVVEGEAEGPLAIIVLAGLALVSVGALAANLL